MKYLLEQSTEKITPQSEAIPGRENEMARNNAGGVSFKADSIARMNRFLILGSESGSYYVGEKDLTKQNVDNLLMCIQNAGLETVAAIVNVSTRGRAAKQDPAIYALARAASYGGRGAADQEAAKVRSAALAALPLVLRTGSHLFTFCAFVDKMRGWGPELRRAVGSWYTAREPDALLYQVAKYQQRDGWSHRDVLRSAHPKSNHPTASLLKWIAKSETDPEAWRQPAEHFPFLHAFIEAKTADVDRLADLIRTYGLTREMIPTVHQKSPKIWEALLEKMPLGAMIRTLGRMSSCGLLVPFSEASKKVVAKLQDPEYIRKSRVHPIQVLSALLTYRQGHGDKGKLTWVPVPQIIDALDAAFNHAFVNAKPTGKNIYLAIDMSGSMLSGPVVGFDGLSACMGASAMAMLIARTEPNYFIFGFNDSLVDPYISRSDSLSAVMQKLSPSGGTDASIPIRHAQGQRYHVDAFVIVSDGETWAGDVHLCQQLRQYREHVNPFAKLIVISMVANKTTLADPEDAGCLDIVGFDTSVPAAIAGFIGADGSDSEPE